MPKRSLSLADHLQREDEVEILSIPFYGTLGFSLLLCVMIAIVFGPNGLFVKVESLSDVFAIRAIYLLSIAVTALIVFLFRFAFSKKWGMRFLYSLSFITALSIIIAFALSRYYGFEHLVAFIYTIYGIAGICSASCFLLWEEHYSRISSQRSVQVSLGAACAAAGIIYCFISFFRQPYNMFFLSTFLLLSLLVYIAAKRRIRMTAATPYIPHKRTRRGLLHLISEIAVAIVCMITLGFTCWYAVNLAFESLDFLYVTICISSMIIGGAIAVVLLVISTKSTAYFLSGLLGPVIALGLIALCIGTKTVSGFALFIIWALLTNCMIIHIANIAKDARNLFHFRIGEPGIALASNALAFLAGFSLGYSDGSFTNWQFDPFLSLVILSVVLILRLFCERYLDNSSRRQYFTNGKHQVLESGSGKVEKISQMIESSETDLHDETHTHEDLVSDILAQIAERYALSPRELDVLACLTRGNTARGISNRLYISTSTVRTHIHNIYTKTGMTSQQELIDYIDLLTAEKTQ